MRAVRIRTLALSVLLCLLAGLLATTSGRHLLPQADAAPRTYYKEVQFSGYKPYCQFIGTLQLADHLRSEGCFDSPYDDFAVVDTKADGYGVAILWTLGTTKRGICRNKLGKGDETRTWPTCRYDGVIPEDRRITAWLSTCNATATRTCKQWGDWRKTDLLKRVYRTTRPAD